MKREASKGHTRRDFLYALGTLGAASFFSLERTEPDLILYNANVWTVNAAQPRAQAIAVAGGRFLAIGSNDEVLALAAGKAKKIDIGGNTILPGFIDAHSHPAEAGLDHLRMVDCDLRSIADILAALRKRASQTTSGQWVLGFKYDDTKTSDGRPLALKDLDEAVPDHPVFIEHRGGHTAWVNSAALKFAQVNDKTPDPPGGRYDHDPATGKLTGHLREQAKVGFPAADSLELHARRSSRRREADCQNDDAHRDHFGHGRLRFSRGSARLPGRARRGRSSAARLLPHRIPVHRSHAGGWHSHRPGR